MSRYLLAAALPLLALCPAAASPPEAPLTIWRFVAIDGKTPISGKTELRIYPDRIAATVGCNRLNAAAKISRGQIKTGPVASTRMHCDGLMEQERAVTQLLGASPNFFIEGDRFALRSRKHSAELIKVPAA
ncbi:MAG: META domain-containing protein [Proteobacteria bacterium]|nr:META domain-containing protein [Pseudomonadota bacterium]